MERPTRLLTRSTPIGFTVGPKNSIQSVLFGSLSRSSRFGHALVSLVLPGEFHTPHYNSEKNGGTRRTCRWSVVCNCSMTSFHRRGLFLAKISNSRRSHLVNGVHAKEPEKEVLLGSGATSKWMPGVCRKNTGTTKSGRRKRTRQGGADHERLSLRRRKQRPYHLKGNYAEGSNNLPN